MRFPIKKRPASWPDSSLGRHGKFDLAGLAVRRIEDGKHYVGWIEVCGFHENGSAPIIFRISPADAHHFARLLELSQPPKEEKPPCTPRNSPVSSLL